MSSPGFYGFPLAAARLGGAGFPPLPFCTAVLFHRTLPSPLSPRLPSWPRHPSECPPHPQPLASRLLGHRLDGLWVRVSLRRASQQAPPHSGRREATLAPRRCRRVWRRRRCPPQQCPLPCRSPATCAKNSAPCCCSEEGRGSGEQEVLNSVMLPVSNRVGTTYGTPGCARWRVLSLLCCHGHCCQARRGQSVAADRPRMSDRKSLVLLIERLLCLATWTIRSGGNPCSLATKLLSFSEPFLKRFEVKFDDRCPA